MAASAPRSGPQQLFQRASRPSIRAHTQEGERDRFGRVTYEVSCLRHDLRAVQPPCHIAKAATRWIQWKRRQIQQPFHGSALAGIAIC